MQNELHKLKALTAAETHFLRLGMLATFHREDPEPYFREAGKMHAKACRVRAGILHPARYN